MRIWTRSRAVIAAASVLAVVGAGVALAAGDGLAEHSASKHTPNGQGQRSVNVGCGKSGNATSTGFKGALRLVNPIENSSEALAIKQTIGAGSGTIGFGSFGRSSKVTAYAYCGGPKLQQSSKRVTADPSGDNNLTSATAKCGNGRVAYSGGFKSAFNFSGPGPGTAIPVSSYRSAKDAWTAEFLSQSDQRPHATAYVYCAKERALSAHVEKKTVHPGNAVTTRNVEAKCGHGEQPVSGGYRPAHPTVGDGPVAIASRRSDSGWTERVAAINQEPNANFKFKAYVYCAS